MRTTGTYLLHLLLGTAGILAAVLTAGWSAHHGSSLLTQIVVGAAAYLTVTGLAGRLTGGTAVDSTTGSITALTAATARLIDITGLVLIAAAALITDNDPAPGRTPIQSAPTADDYAKTA